MEVEEGRAAAGTAAAEEEAAAAVPKQMPTGEAKRKRINTPAGKVAREP
jgi:hypothetical protein